MHQLAISHISALLNQTTSSSHRKYNQRDHIELTTHPQTNIDCHSTAYLPGNKLADSAAIKTAKWQPAMLKSTPASDLIDTLRKYVPLEKSTRKQQTSTHHTSAKHLEAINVNLLGAKNIPPQVTPWPYICYTCAPPHKLTSSCLSPLWKHNHSEKNNCTYLFFFHYLEHHRKWFESHFELCLGLMSNLMSFSPF